MFFEKEKHFFFPGNGECFIYIYQKISDQEKVWAETNELQYLL